MPTRPTHPFHLGDILSVLTGKLLGPTGMDGVYAVLKHLSGTQVETHQVPRVMDETRPGLRKQFPQLNGVVPVNLSGADQYRDWLAQQVARYGELHEVETLPAEEVQDIDPISEAAERFPPDRIIKL